jgi:iron(III) transport system permease protein
MVMHYYAFSYIMVSGSLRSINSELRRWAKFRVRTKYRFSRASRSRSFYRHSLGAIMTISKSIGSYGFAANLGNRISYYVHATRMKEFYQRQPQGVVTR